MEDEPLTLGVEDGTIEVESLLVEPQHGHVSMDSVLYSNEKILHNAMGMEDVSRSFGRSSSGIGHESGDNLHGEVLDVIPTEIGDVYFQMQSDFCTMGEDYLSGVAFAESITNLDYNLNEGLQSSISDSSILTSSADNCIPCKSDMLGIMVVPEYQDAQLNIQSYETDQIPSSQVGTLVEKKPSKTPKSCALANTGKFQDIFSSCSFQNVSVDENDGSLCPSFELLCGPEILGDDNFGLIGHNVENNRVDVDGALGKVTTQASSTDSLPAQKRQRKATQRYIDELMNPFIRHPLRKREASSFLPKNKSLGLRRLKKCQVKPRGTRFLNEEPSVVAIQVPFGSVVQKESQKKQSFDLVSDLNCQSLIVNSNDYRVDPVKPQKLDNPIETVDQKKKDDFAMAACQKKRDDSVNIAHLSIREKHFETTVKLKKNNEYALPTNSKKNDDHFLITSLRELDRLRAAHQKKTDDFFTFENPEEITARRKQHRLWTISEVRKLIDGVSEYGVGRWSRIKKIFFATSSHRTSIDIKDKWRNLLKASGCLEQNKKQGEKKRSIAWRPLPKSILHRVCELANEYPYPKGQKPKIARVHDISPDESSDITLSDYVRIIRSINGN